MNQRIRELADEAGIDTTDFENCPIELYGAEQQLNKFAELIVKEMLRTCEDHPGWSGRMIGEQIKQHFGIEKPKGWICPKCSADRTKIACPLGFGAQVDGRCPMVVTAQGVQE
jgi:hypothetical protein